MNSIIHHIKKPLVAGIIGFLFGSIVGPVAVSFIDLNLFEKTRTQNEAKVEIAKNLVADIEKIKVIAPSNTLFKECLATKEGETFEDNYEECFSELRQQQEESRSILQRNISSVQLFFDPVPRDTITDIINEMDYLLYEMRNNQYVTEAWNRRGCPDLVSIVSFEEAKEHRDDVPKDSDGNVKCALALQTRQEFNDSIEADGVCDDCISALEKRFVEDEYINSLIVPGDTMSFKEYMISKNSTLYSVFLANADYLLGILRDNI